jgi:hypothetical protein
MHTPSGKEIEMSPEEFTQYIESVYRHQNQVTTKLIGSVGDFDADVDEPAQVTAAVRKMVRVCEPFSKIVSQILLTELTGKGPNLELANSVPACDAASKEVEELLP